LFIINFGAMKDNFSKQAALYSKYRPHYPKELFDFILDKTNKRNTAWDCGTGNGQTAQELALHFQKVYATDISQKQLDSAYKASNIFYSVQAAEQTDFPDNCIDLVTVSQALHWFRFADFYKEVKRVALPGSWIAAWTYSLLHISEEMDKLINTQYYKNTLNGYWDAERKYVDAAYQTIPFPFKKIDTPVFQIKLNWTLDELEGYLNTWSATQKFIAANQFNPVTELMKQVKECWHPNEEGTMPVVFPLHLCMGQIEK
jgi:ubiquinone/menaquinone biosynthesis C-methylase UbiE